MANPTGTPITVGTTPTLLAVGTSNTDPVQVKVKNRGAASIYVGGTDVTTSTGYQIANDDPSEDFYLGASDRLYGICQTGTVVVQVLRMRQ